MQIDIKGRNVPVPDELRRHAERRLTKVARQVSDLARLEIELLQEPNPRGRRAVEVVEATLYLKGVTLRARDASPRDGALAEPRGRRARPPGQAPPRDAPSPAQDQGALAGLAERASAQASPAGRGARPLHRPFCERPSTGCDRCERRRRGRRGQWRIADSRGRRGRRAGLDRTRRADRRRGAADRSARAGRRAHASETAPSCARASSSPAPRSPRGDPDWTAPIRAASACGADPAEPVRRTAGKQPPPTEA